MGACGTNLWKLLRTVIFLTQEITLHLTSPILVYETLPQASLPPGNGQNIIVDHHYTAQAVSYIRTASSINKVELYILTSRYHDPSHHTMAIYHGRLWSALNVPAPDSLEAAIQPTIHCPQSERPRLPRKQDPHPI